MIVSVDVGMFFCGLLSVLLISGVHVVSQAVIIKMTTAESKAKLLTVVAIFSKKCYSTLKDSRMFLFGRHNVYLNKCDIQILKIINMRRYYYLNFINM